MSSTGPIPQPGAEVLTRYLDILGQQQQEMIEKLTLAQQQAAIPVPTKTLPAPGLTAEALQAKLKDLLTTLTTTVQRQEQALREDRASGGVTALQAGWNIAETHGALDLTMGELRTLKGHMDTLQSRLDEQRRLDQMKLDNLKQSYAQALNTASTVQQKFNELKNSIISNIS
jgi:hypothetical protein